MLARKNHDTSYARLILDELKSSSTNFDGLCNSISEIQRLTKSRSKRSTGEKEVHLASVEGDGMFKGKCRDCGKVCGYKAVDCKKRKGELHSGCGNNGDSEGNTGAMYTIRTHTPRDTVLYLSTSLLHDGTDIELYLSTWLLIWYG
jgi:hypothetical protein